MQKAFSLQPHEVSQAQQLEQERTNVLAQIGALTLDMENARAQLPIVDQKRRQYLQSLIQQYGVAEYRTARIDGQNLVCDVPDLPAAPPLPPPGRVNGVELTKE